MSVIIIGGGEEAKAAIDKLVQASKEGKVNFDQAELAAAIFRELGKLANDTNGE